MNNNNDDAEHHVFNPVNTAGTLYDKTFFAQPTTIRMGDVIVAFQGQLADARLLKHCSVSEAKESVVVGTSPITIENATECPAMVYGPATVPLDQDLFPVHIDPGTGNRIRPLCVGHRVAIITHKDTHDASKWGRWAPLKPDRERPWNGFPDDPWLVSPAPVNDEEAWGRFAARHHHRRHYVPGLVPPPATCAPENEYQLEDRVFAFVCEWVLSPRFDIRDAAQLVAVMRKFRYDPLPAMVLRFDLTRRSRRPVTEPPVRRAVREEALIIGITPANKQIDLVRDF